MSKLVEYRVERGGVAVVTLNRVEKRNAINEPLIKELREAILRAQDEAVVGVIAAQGANFSAGLDLNEALARATSAPPVKRFRHSWHEVFDLLARGPIPWVASLQGAVVGGGLELAAAAHVRVCDETAFFGLPEGQRGIFVGGGGTVRIQRIIGYSVMADMMLTGRLLNSEEALQVNIVRYVTPPGDALEKALILAERIAGNSSETNWKIVNVLPRINDLSHDDGLFMEYLTSSMQRSPDSAERLREFLSGKSKPLKVTQSEG